MIFEIVLIVLLPVIVHAILSIFNELLFFQGFAFIYPFYFALCFIYVMVRYHFRERRLLMLVSGFMLQYGYAIGFYVVQQRKFTEYAIGNNLPLDLDGLIPLAVALTVNAFIYLGLALVIGISVVFYKIYKTRGSEEI